MKILKTKYGFSLLELLIVVAIIGILAAVAIPTYTDYTAEAKCQQVVAPVHSLMVSLVGDLAENGTGAMLVGSSKKIAGEVEESLTVNGTSHRFPKNIHIEFTSTNYKYSITGTRTDGFVCPAGDIYVLQEDQSEGSWLASR